MIAWRPELVGLSRLVSRALARGDKAQALDLLVQEHGPRLGRRIFHELLETVPPELRLRHRRR